LKRRDELIMLPPKLYSQNVPNTTSYSSQWRTQIATKTHEIYGVQYTVRTINDFLCIGFNID